MPQELERERTAIREQVLRQAGVDARISRTSVAQMRAGDLEADILTLPDLPTAGGSSIQVLDPTSAHFGSLRFIPGVTPFTDIESVII